MRRAVLSAFFTVAMIVTSLPFFSPRLVQAGCGCDKPAPAPAAIIPNAAYPGMKVTLFNNTLQNGQTWTVTFQNGGKTVSTKATVVTKRVLTDPSGLTVQPQLVVPVPSGLPMGPTQIVASKKSASFTVPDSSFTLIGKPLPLSEGGLSYSVTDYTTGVGVDGTLYLAIGGLEHVCQPSAFLTVLENYPLRFGVGDVVILNHQGFFIDVLDEYSTDRAWMTPALLSPGTTSNALLYYRHSFEQYCANHLSGGLKEVDAQDPNWHLDGSAHTEYSALIFAIAGHFDDGSRPQPGSVSFNIDLLSWLGQPGESWTQEQEEEKSNTGAKAPTAPTGGTNTKTSSRKTSR
jgi:hypothetical protein